MSKIYTGFIMLCSESGEVSTCKKYRSRAHRQEIINSWILIYRLENRQFSFQISPDIDEQSISGSISIDTEKKKTEIQYRSVEQRDRIIQEISSKEKINYITINPAKNEFKNKPKSNKRLQEVCNICL
jgi:hypothetical protein